MGLRLEDKRKIDAEITEAFLKKEGNRNLAGTLARRFSEIIRQSMEDKNSIADKCHFYLKGGNSISVLKSQDRTGDYDFQFAPELGVYEKWDEAFEKVDKLLIEALLKAVAGMGGGEAFDDGCVDLDGILERVLHKTPKELNLQKPEGHDSSIQLFGREYATASYHDIVKQETEVNGQRRIGQFKVEEYGQVTPEKHGLHIYVNYMIPGFLLYRLVRTFECRLEGEKAAFKSELIDVSVPRPGSAECYLSQEGVITHFREKDGFLIPGWGYHFYENINLLQEVALNRSGSPQKKEKRKKRLGECVEQLLQNNEYNVLPLLYGPMKEDSNGLVLGYAGAVNYPLTGFCPAEGGLSLHMREETQRHLKTVASSMTWEGAGSVRNLGTYIPDVEEQEVRSIQTSTIQNFSSALSQLFVAYHTKPSRDTYSISPGNAAEALERLLKEAGVSDSDYCKLSPLSKLDRRLPFAAGFILTAVTKGAFKQLLDYTEKCAAEDVKEREGNSLGLVVHAKGGAFYALFRARENWDPKELEKEKERILAEMLNRSILFTQRCALEEFFQSR